MTKLWRWWINPEVHAKVHLILTLFWSLMIIPTLLWWTESVPYLVSISLYAIITGHFSSYEATRAEIITKKQIEGEFDDMHDDERLEDVMERHR
jgi:hypothetical protein